MIIALMLVGLVALVLAIVAGVFIYRGRDTAATSPPDDVLEPDWSERTG